MLKLRTFVKLLVLGVALSMCQAADTEEARRARLKVNDNFQTKCGHIKAVGIRIEDCSRVLVDIIEGTLPKWPKEPNDMGPICEKFERAEKCVREVTRECLGGLKRTIGSTYASAVGRCRKRECVPSNYGTMLRAIQCVENNQQTARNLMRNSTDHLRIITDQMANLDRRTTGVCCMLDEVENNIRRGLTPICPNDVGTIVRLYRATVEDISNIMCRAPKCVDIFRGYSTRPSKDTNSIVALLLESLFSIC